MHITCGALAADSVSKHAYNMLALAAGSVGKHAYNMLGSSC